jgi:RPA family protein
MTPSTQTEENDNMATNTDSNTDMDERQDRHPAVRVFASEFQDSEYVFKTEDSDRAPKYTLLPSGQRVNRVLVVGALMEVQERESDNDGFVNARVHDGDDFFYITASRYQADEATALKELKPVIDEYGAAHVAIVGKVNHWYTDDDEHMIEIAPEEVSQVSAEDRYQWALETAEATRDRVNRFNDTTDQEIEAGTADADVKMAREQYDIDPSRYLETARAAVNGIILGGGDGDE